MEIQKHQISGKENSSSRKYLLPFILVTSLFFLWGIAHNLNGVLIPHLKKACQLSNSQSALVDTSIFFAYFLMAIPAGLLLKRLGYKYSIVIGLFIFAVGAFLFIPAANTRMYELFLFALFVIGCGLAILETAANPYAAGLGKPEGASQRLNLAASFNGLAAMIAPIIGANYILSGKEYSNAELEAMAEPDKLSYLMAEAASVKGTYLVLGAVLVVVAILFIFVKFPEINVEKEEKKPEGKQNFFTVLKKRHLSFAVIAQFFYVGAQVCVTSFFIRMAQQGGGIDEKTAGYYLGIYGFLFMFGRFVGTFILRYVTAPRLLSIYAAVSILLCMIAILGDGAYVIYALGSIGFFMSIMFPTIFSLGIVNLGEDVKVASSWLIMAIVGGAIVPYIMGSVIDLSNDNIQVGYIIPLICFILIFFYGLKGYKPRALN